MSHPVTTVARVSLLSAWCLLWGASSADAQSVGIRGGLSQNPNQVFAGLQFESAPFRPGVTLRPVVEAGTGDRMETVVGSLDIIYRPSASPAAWAVYLGGGPTANAYWSKVGSMRERDFGFGGTVLLGFEHESRTFFELKVAFGDGPHMKLVVGFAFGG